MQTFEEVKELYNSTSLFELAEMATEIRNKLNDPETVTYVVDRNINYTNICVSECRFCAFHKKPGSPDGFVIDKETLYLKLKELEDVGGTQILFQGGLNPDLPLEFYIDMLKDISNNFPNLHLHAFSPPEIVFIAEKFNMEIKGLLEKFQEAGLKSIPGGGAEILSDQIRSGHSKIKCSADKWIEVMRTAHNLGMKTTATMMFGHTESLENRYEHWNRIYNLQSETGGFTAFIAWPFQPKFTKLSDISITGGVEYLKTLAISRIILSNFKHIQASWVTMGQKIAQAALSFGADDMGGTMLEENVVKAAGCVNSANEKEIRLLIENAGFKPQKRSTLYKYLKNQ